MTSIGKASNDEMNEKIKAIGAIVQGLNIDDVAIVTGFHLLHALRIAALDSTPNAGEEFRRQTLNEFLAGMVELHYRNFSDDAVVAQYKSGLMADEADKH